MAAPAYATDLNDIFLDGGGTAWFLIGGGRQTDPETDDFIQGNSCWSHDPFSSGIEGGLYPSTETVNSGDAVFVWIKCDVVATLAAKAAGGMQVCIGSATTAYNAYYIRGSDDYAYGGWICVPVDPANPVKSQSAQVGSPSAPWSQFGGRWNVPSTGAGKGYPMKIDAMRHGRQIEVTAGDSGTPASWNSVSAYDAATTRMWGICQPTDAGAALQGLIYWGTATTAVYSRDSNRTIVIIDTEWTATDFTQILFAHASNDVVWDNVGLVALGTNNRGIIDVTANGAITWTNSVFQDIDVTTLLSSSTFDGTKWLSTNGVTAGGASLLGSKILTPTVAADTYALLWNVSTDTDGKLDGMEFSIGATAHHAISFTDNTTVEYTLRGIDFSGFNVADGQNSSALYFPDSGSDIDWVINTVGCTGDIKYKKVRAGDTVTIVSDPVTHNLTGMIENSEVTYMKRGAAVDTGSDGSTTVGSRNFVTTNSWATDAYKGHLLYITSGADAGRYYCYGNNATTLYLDKDMTATAGTLNWELYDENDDIEVFHLENVPASGISGYAYTAGADVDVDIYVHKYDYYFDPLLGVTLSSSDASIPIAQIPDVNYFNPT